MYLDGTRLGSVKMKSAHLLQVTEFKYLGSTMQRDEYKSKQDDTLCGWNNWRTMPGVLCDKRVPPHVKGKIHKWSSSQLYCTGWRQCQWLAPHVKKLEVTELKMCRWACGHTLRDQARNGNTRERLKVVLYHREVQESKTCLVWPRKEARPLLRRKKYSGGGTTWDKKKRTTEAEMDGLCQLRHESHRDNTIWSAW